MKTVDLQRFFEHISLQSDGGTNVSLVCVDVPYTLVRLMLTGLVPDYIHMVYGSTEPENILLVYLDGSDYRSVMRSLAAQHKLISATSERELFSDSPVLDRLCLLLQEAKDNDP